MLKMREVTKTFGRFRTLKELSMTVPKGVVYGLVGPNGAGKTTAIRHLTGVYRPDSGTVSLEGMPIYENPQAKARIGYIPDEVFFFPGATIEDMRRYYLGMYHNFDDQLYERMFDVFPLLRKSPMQRYSKGMQKQAAFLLNLCMHPEVLILDEPVDGLDPVMRRQVWSLILSDVAQRGTTVLLSSHNLRELEDICDHVGIMDHGKMIMERSLEQMQGNIAKVQIVGQVPRDLEVIHDSSSGRLHTLIVRGKPEEVSQQVAALKPVYFDVLPLSLEEIFIYELGGVDYEIRNILL